MGQQSQALGKCAALLEPPICLEVCPLPTLSSPQCATALVTNSQEKKVKVVPGQAIYALWPFSSFWIKYFFHGCVYRKHNQAQRQKKKILLANLSPLLSLSPCPHSRARALPLQCILTAVLNFVWVLSSNLAAGT